VFVFLCKVYSNGYILYQVYLYRYFDYICMEVSYVIFGLFVRTLALV